MATPVVNIIDPDSGAGYDYTSLNTWESNEQADISVTTGSDEQHTATCRSTGGTDDLTGVYLLGWTTEEPDNYIKIWTDPGESYRHVGVWETGNKYRLQTDATQRVAILSLIHI